MNGFTKEELESSLPDAWDMIRIDLECSGASVPKVIVQDNTVRGWMLYDVHRAHIHLRRIAVDPAFQRQGFGAALLDNIVNGAWLRHRTRELTVRIYSHQYEAAAWFRKQRFSVVKTGGVACDHAGAFSMRMELGVPDGAKGVLA